MKSTQVRTPQPGSEAGQATIILLLALGTFLLGSIGFATDFANLWFHQQRAQSAADAACQAGAMDMLSVADGTKTTSAIGFTPGSSGFDCSSNSATAPCKYAAFNGYSGTGLVSGSESSQVAVSFPSSINGATAPPTGVAGSYPFIEVDVIDRIRVYFSAVITGKNTQDVKTIAKCGLVLENSPIPILVLDPKSDTGTFKVQGTPAVSIYGGPTRSIQVNTPTSTAIQLGGSGSVNLSKGGPTDSGSTMGVVGGPYSLTTLLTGNTTFTPNSAAYYDPADTPINDPFAQLAAPSHTGMTTYPKISTTTVTYHTNGCPDPGGCEEYLPGYYPNGIQVKNATAIFDAGIYYVVGGFAMDANSILRPAVIGGSAAGSMFYLSGNSGSISVASNSGTKTLAHDGIDQFNTSNVTCPGETAQTVTDTNGNPVTALDGNVLLGSCSDPTYGDPLGQNRGMLFFEDRAATFSNTNQPSFGGGGGLLVAGNLYFHNCNSSGTGTSCTSSAYTDVLSMGGNSGSGTYVLGDIITDQLILGGTSGISMQLNPTAAYNVLKVELLQ